MTARRIGRPVLFFYIQFCGNIITIHCKKSTVHYIGKIKRNIITDNIYIVGPLGGRKTSGGCLLHCVRRTITKSKISMVLVCADRNEMETTMRIAICDDEKRICAILAGKVEKICPGAEIMTYTSGEELLGADKLPDILLLDIKMPGMSGMDVAKTLRDRDWRKILIFITGEEDQVFNSFDHHAFHFLVKPVADGKLKEVLENAVKDLERSGAESGKHDKYIEIQSGTSHIRVNLSLLLYAEVYDRKTIIHLKNESIEYYGQLSALESLVGKDFYRIHRYYLVNMKYVERYDRTSVTLTGGDNIPISRREYDGFLKAYLEYSRRRIDS